MSLAFSPRTARDAVEASLAVAAVSGGNLRADVLELPDGSCGAYFSYEADLSRVFYVRAGADCDVALRELYGQARQDGRDALRSA